MLSRRYYIPQTGGFMDHVPSLSSLRKRKASLLNKIACLGDFRLGSLTERYRRCGKPRCHCAREDSRGHGPSWSVTRKVAGKTVTKVIKSDAVDVTRGQIDEYHQFQDLVHEFVETNVKICDALLEAESNDDSEGAEKKGSRDS